MVILSWPQRVKEYGNPSHHDANFIIGDNEVSWRQSPVTQWRQNWHHDNFLVSVTVSILRIPRRRHDMEILSALLAICESIPPVANAKCHKCGALVFFLSLAWTNCWTNSELSAIWVFIWCHCDNSSTREHDNAERALMERHLHVESIQLTSEVEKISRVGWLGRSGAPEFTYMRARPTNMTCGHCDKTLATVSIWSLSYIESITLFSSWF